MMAPPNFTLLYWSPSICLSGNTDSAVYLAGSTLLGSRAAVCQLIRIWGPESESTSVSSGRSCHWWVKLMYNHDFLCTSHLNFLIGTTETRPFCILFYLFTLSSASRKYFPKFTEKEAEFTIKFTTEIKITIMVKNSFYCIFV